MPLFPGDIQLNRKYFNSQSTKLSESLIKYIEIIILQFKTNAISIKRDVNIYNYPIRTCADAPYEQEILKKFSLLPSFKYKSRSRHLTLKQNKTNKQKKKKLSVF